MISAIFSKRQLWLAPLIAVTVGLTSCGGSETPTDTATEGTPGEQTASGGGDLSASLSGAGASFPAPYINVGLLNIIKSIPEFKLAISLLVAVLVSSSIYKEL